MRHCWCCNAKKNLAWSYWARLQAGTHLAAYEGVSIKDSRPFTRFLGYGPTQRYVLEYPESPAFITTLPATGPSLQLGPRER